jgi:uncharacterized short protein YbdD (DUF466 family)
MRGETRGNGAAGQRGSASWKDRIGATIRRIAGMPDYSAHVEHLRRCHPGLPLPTEREFFEEYLKTRYSQGASRCC